MLFKLVANGYICVFASNCKKSQRDKQQIGELDTKMYRHTYIIHTHINIDIVGQYFEWQKTFPPPPPFFVLHASITFRIIK